MYCLQIFTISSFVSLAISAVTVEITPGKSTKTIRGSEGPRKNYYKILKIPLTVKEITSLETVRPVRTEFLIRNSISLRNASKSDSLIRSYSRSLSLNCAIW